MHSGTLARWLLSMSATLVVALSARSARADEAPPAAVAVAVATDPSYTIVPGGLEITADGAVRALPLPDCEPKAIAREGDRVFVACGPSGLLLLDAADPKKPTVGARVPTDGDAVALHVVSGKVWVELTRSEARPVASLIRAAQHFGATPPAGAAPATGAAVGEPGDATAEQPTRKSLAAPPRRSSLWELQLGTRAFLPIGNIGAGLVGNASVAYRFNVPVAVYGELSPLGVAGGKQGTIGSVGGYAIVALDTQLFELGLGVGAATLSNQRSDASSSLSFAQLARIGARDGFALFVRSNIIVVNDEFEIGSIAVTGQAPIGQRWWLHLAGGGGPIGFAYGDLGVRYLVQGDLGPGSFFVTGTVGGAGLFKSKESVTTTPSGSFTFTSKSASYVGPALGINAEIRF